MREEGETKVGQPFGALQITGIVGPQTTPVFHLGNKDALRSQKMKHTSSGNKQKRKETQDKMSRGEALFKRARMK